MDSHGEVVLWERRRPGGRRKGDAHWLSRKDIPGFLLMGFLFLVLSLSMAYLWRSGAIP